MIMAALDRLNDQDLKLRSVSSIIMTPPIGPSRRTFANAVALIETSMCPIELLSFLKRLERYFGRRTGRRWGARTLDLDIIFWSGGIYADKHLTIPHRSFRERTFVLAPMVQITAQWRDPVTGLTPRHLHARLKKPKPVDRRGKPD